MGARRQRDPDGGRRRARQKREAAGGYSFAWIAAGFLLLVLSLRRSLLDVAAKWLGVYYPPAVLLLVLVFIVFGVSLGFSVVVSRQRRQIRSAD